MCELSLNTPTPEEQTTSGIPMPGFFTDEKGNIYTGVITVTENQEGEQITVGLNLGNLTAHSLTTDSTGSDPSS